MIDLPNGNFLLPDATALVEGAVFLVVLFVVSKFVLPRLQDMAIRRQRLIEHDLSSAAAAKVAARRHEEEAAALIGQARREARAIIDEAYERRDYVVAEGMRKGREEYEWFTRTLDPVRTRLSANGDAAQRTFAASRSSDENSEATALKVG
jgi:F-type H+-transporting ATPase subunit b